MADLRAILRSLQQSSTKMSPSVVADLAGTLTAVLSTEDRVEELLDLLEAENPSLDAFAAVVTVLGVLSNHMASSEVASEAVSTIVASDAFVKAAARKLPAALPAETSMGRTNLQVVISVIRKLAGVLETLEAGKFDEGSSKRLMVLASTMKEAIKEIGTLENGDHGNHLEGIVEKLDDFVLALNRKRPEKDPDRLGSFRKCSILKSLLPGTPPGKVEGVNPVIEPRNGHQPFESVDDYLSTHFYLLLEDFALPIRSSWGTSGESVDSGWHLHGQVKVLRSLLVKQDVVWELALQDEDVAAKFGRTDWETSKLLLPGSLILLDANPRGSATVMGTVVVNGVQEQRGDQLRQGRVCIVIKQIYPDQSIFTERCCSWTMMESKVYFEAYSHVLRGLQALRRPPLVEELVFSERCQGSRPPYLARKDFKINMDSLLCKKVLSKSRADLTSLDLYRSMFYAKEDLASKDRGPDQAVVDLDDFQKASWAFEPNQRPLVNPSQLEAVKSAFRNSVALIQGPPGTGKSHVGKWLIRLLIDNNEHLWPDVAGGIGPILVVCHTNRALDAILEAFLDRKVVRVGGRSRSDALEFANLTSVKAAATENRLTDRTLYNALKRAEAQVNALKSILEKSLESENHEVDSRSNPSFIQYRRWCRKLEDLRTVESAAIVNKADVVGMTTTGAAKNWKLLRRTNAKVVLVEEAGQILESHIITALPPSCQHLIMIGDHQQLKPAVASYRMAKDFNLDVSLFERLVRTGFPLTVLNEQHRMRPEISTVVANTFYPGLTDHPSVRSRPHLAGFAKSFYFLKHEFREDKEDGLPGGSKVNRFEAELALHLARYAIANGCQAKDITILTPYIGQLLLLRKMCLQKFEDLNEGGLVMQVVDNYQGEENEVVILSLVRSNEEGSIGFLRADSRICVALSRAKRGLIILGNMKDLCRSSGTWRRINGQLESQGAIGDTLRIICPLHPSSSDMEIKAPSDMALFQAKSDDEGHSTEGRGCRQDCGQLLECGHACPWKCHVQDQAHSGRFACQAACEKSCPRGHACSRKCSQDCGPCQFASVQVLPCPGKHRALVLCGQPVAEVVCPEKCLAALSRCGHLCDLPCHPETKPHNIRCSKVCTRPKLGCDMAHPCQNLCYQPCEGRCNEPLEGHLLPCGHQVTPGLRCHALQGYRCKQECGRNLDCGHRCGNLCHKCSQGCPPCQVVVDQAVLRCGIHRGTAVCSSQVSLRDCPESCPKILEEPCGHPCPLRCGDPCPSSGCGRLLTGPPRPGCGHPGEVECGGSSTEYVGSCQALCDQVIPSCGHVCKSVCGSSMACLGGRVHGPCSQVCGRRLVCGHVCGGVCGLPCEPCEARRCLFRLCQHPGSCKAKCQDPCNSSCKEKCSSACVHSKCSKKCNVPCNRSPCTEPCPKQLQCGHNCLGFCGEECPDLCLECHPEAPLFKDDRYLRLPCGHSAPALILREALASPAIIGPLVCMECRQPIGFMERFRDEFKRRKASVVQIGDTFFLRGSSVTKTLESYVTGCDLENEEFGKQALKLCRDKRNLLHPSDAAQLLAKAILLNNLSASKEKDLTDIKWVLERLLSLGPAHLETVLKLIQERTRVEGLSHEDKVLLSENFLCYSADRWKFCSKCEAPHPFASWLPLSFPCVKSSDKCQPGS